MLPPKTRLATPYYRLLRRLWRQGPAPTRLLFRELDFSKTVGGRLIDQMAHEGVAGFDEEQNLRILGTYGTVLGLHMGTRTVTAALVDFTGELQLSEDFPYPVGSPLVQAVLQSVRAMEHRLRSPDMPPLRGVAVSLPGIVDPYRLVLLRSKPLGIDQPLDLKETLGRALGRPLTAENDANCCCWGEAAVQRHRKLGNFLFLLAERRPYSAGDPLPVLPAFSVGSGLYLNGSVYHGTRFSAGEFQSIFKEGPDQRNQFSVTDEQMTAALVDPALEEQIARELSRNAALLVNSLNLDRVFVSWPRQEMQQRVVDILRHEIQHNWSYEYPVDCAVELPVMGRLAPAYGAAGLHLESLYQMPDGPAPYFPGKN